MKILVTGAAGFIGFHVVLKLLDNKMLVIGVDNLNNYYDPSLKEKRLRLIKRHKMQSNFQFIRCDIANKSFIRKLFAKEKFDMVINLAAQAGVRYSLKKPYKYIDSNINGFINILEGCRLYPVEHLIFASSSSVYGMNTAHPFSTNDCTDFPVSLYAATKKSNELMGFSYSHLYQIPITGLRFFTVYGPFGRPDMAYFSFTKKILNNEKIDIYNNGDMYRDFTYIDDIVSGILKVISKPPSIAKPKSSNAMAPFALYNIGNNSPVSLSEFIEAIENACGRKAIKNFMPMQQGDVPKTYANIDDLVHDFGFTPSTDINKGIKQFVNWYKNNYQYL